MKNWPTYYLILFFQLLTLSPLTAQSDSIIDADTLANLESPVEKDISLSKVGIKVLPDGDQMNMIISSPNLEGRTSIKMNGEEKILDFKNGKATLSLTPAHAKGLIFLKSSNKNIRESKLVHIKSSGQGESSVKNIPLWLSIVPPLMAIILALIFREVITALFIGIWSGAFIATGMRPGYLIRSFWEVVEKYIIEALIDADHMSVIIFSLLIGGMVAIISRNGGMAGVVQSLSGLARSAKTSQFTTWLLGVAIFFDDYANTLIVGNTMRSVTDKYKVSREKLAYIVDSTAAPVSAIFFITTWIGAELGYIQTGVEQLENFDTSISPYALFISSLKYSFYPVLTLIFILIIIFTEKDYGPMYKAEKRARTTGRVSSAMTEEEDEPNMEDLTPVKGAPLLWYNAAIPVFTVILLTIYGLIESGMVSIHGELSEIVADQGVYSWGNVWSNLHLLMDDPNAGFFTKLGTLIGAANSYQALLWASLSGVLVALVLTLAGRIMKILDAMHTMTMGFKTMMPALIILTLAWALAISTNQLHTADYLTSLIQDSVSPYAMPVIVFVLAALIAFSTGSSWSTMAILYPIGIPITWAICQGAGLGPDISMELLLNVIAVTLAASVLGDHCSPISDTTILSSLASDCNHIDHVQTQMPYALTVGAFAITAGGLSTYLGGGWLISTALLFISIALLYLIVQKIGKSTIQ